MLIIDQMIKADEEIFWKWELWLSISELSR